MRVIQIFVMASHVMSYECILYYSSQSMHIILLRSNTSQHQLSIMHKVVFFLCIIYYYSSRYSSQQYAYSYSSYYQYELVVLVAPATSQTLCILASRVCIILLARSMHTTSQTSTRSTSQQYSLLPFPTCARAPSPPPTVAPSPPVGSVSKNATPPCPAGSLLSVAKLSGVGVYDHGCSFGLQIRPEWTALKVVEPFFGLAYIRVRGILIPLRESCTQRVRAENYYVQARMAPTVYGGAIRFMYCY